MNNPQKNIDTINVGDTFKSNNNETWTVIDLFVPDQCFCTEQLTLEDSNGNVTLFPDNFGGYDYDVNFNKFFN